MCIYIYTYIHIYIYISVCVCTVCIYVFIYLYVCVCDYLWIYNLIWLNLWCTFSTKITKAPYISSTSPCSRCRSHRQWPPSAAGRRWCRPRRQPWPRPRWWLPGWRRRGPAAGRGKWSGWTWKKLENMWEICGEYVENMWRICGEYDRVEKIPAKMGDTYGNCVDICWFRRNDLGRDLPSSVLKNQHWKLFCRKQ